LLRSSNSTSAKSTRACFMILVSVRAPSHSNDESDGGWTLLSTTVASTRCFSPVSNSRSSDD